MTPVLGCAGFVVDGKGRGTGHTAPGEACCLHVAPVISTLGPASHRQAEIGKCLGGQSCREGHRVCGRRRDLCPCHTSCSLAPPALILKLHEGCCSLCPLGTCWLQVALHSFPPSSIYSEGIPGAVVLRRAHGSAPLAWRVAGALDGSCVHWGLLSTPQMPAAPPLRETHVLRF